MILYFTGFVSDTTLIPSLGYYFLCPILSTSYSDCQNNVPIGAILSVWVRALNFLNIGLRGNGFWHSQEYNPAFANGGISESIWMLTAPKDE